MEILSEHLFNYVTTIKYFASTYFRKDVKIRDNFIISITIKMKFVLTCHTKQNHKIMLQQIIVYNFTIKTDYQYGHNILELYELLVRHK